MEDVVDIHTYIPGISIVATLIFIVLTTMCLHIRKRRHISKPTNIRVSDVTSDSVTLQWTKPTHGSRYVTSYKIFMQTSGNQEDQEWMSDWTSMDDHMTVSGLKPKTSYIFKVRPECGRSQGKESDATEPVETKPDRPGTPQGKPVATSVTESSIDLTWGEPEYGCDLVTGYVVLYRKTQSQTEEWKELLIEGAGCCSPVDGLNSETEYSFKVQSKGESGRSPESELSEPIITDKVLSKRLKERSKKMSKDNQHPEVYKLPMKQVTSSRYILGDQPNVPTNQKVLMLVGPSGGGKTSLVNFVANYILGVRFEDDFRFELGGGEHDSERCMSETNEVTAYTFCPMKGSCLSYTLTIIDTPGFGNTRGSDVDSTAVAQLLKFLSNERDQEVCLLNGVGLVAQASTTPDQKFMLESILGTLGKDLYDNIFLLVTFCDSADENPPIADIAKVAELPYNGRFFKFGTSTPSSTSDKWSSLSSWDTSIAGLNAFFEQFEKAKPISVENTKEVLSEWRNLEEAIKSMYDMLSSGYKKFTELRQAGELLKKGKEATKENQNFSYKVKRTTLEHVNLPSNERALNCLKCSVTCKYPYDNSVGIENEAGNDFCDVCPRQCCWKEHAIENIRHTISKFTETVTSKEREARYNNAKREIEQSREKIGQLKLELSQLKEDIVAMSEGARKHRKHLSDIAMKPQTLTDFGGIDEMILKESAEKRDGYMDRVKELKLKMAARMLAESHDCNGASLLTVEDWWSEYCSQIM